MAALDPPVSTLEDRLLGADRRDEGGDSSPPRDDQAADQGFMERLFHILGGGGGGSPVVEPEAGGRVSDDEASATAAEAQKSLDPLAMFPTRAGDQAIGSEFAGSDDEESDGESEEGGGENICYYLQSKLLIILATLASLATIGLSIFVQVMPWSYATIGKNAVYVRWICMVGTIVPVYYVVRKILSRVFVLIELRLFRDSLAYLSNLKNATVNMAFAYVELAIFYIVFHVAFCFGKFEKTCDDPVYYAKSVIGMQCLLCLGLFFTASWLACLASKMLSTHFYKSTHFKKFREALNREYVLHALSMPKRKVIRLHHNQAGAQDGAHPVREPGWPTATPNRAAPSSTSSSSSVAININKPGTPRAEESRDMRADASVPSSIPNSQPQLNTVAEEHSEPSNHLLKEAGLAPEEEEGAMPSRLLLSDSSRLENVLTEDMLRAVPMAVNEEVTIEELDNEDKLERLRTAVVVKTYSKLVHLYKLKPNLEMESRMLRRVKAFSRALFKNMSWHGEHAAREYVTLEDFEHFFEPTRQGRAEAARAFALFDWDSTGKVDREQTAKAVMAIFNQRASVASALEDTDSIVQSLESGFAGGMHFLFIAFYLHIWFESLLFLFNEHPYDVGDMVGIDEQVYEVKKVRLLYTVMLDMYGHTIYFSSKELLEKRVVNWSRSRNHTDYMFPEVDVGVASVVKTELRARMSEHIKEYRTEYEAPAVVIMKTMTANNLKVVMMISYTMNFSPDQWERLCAARDSMMQIVSDVLAKYQQSGELEHTTARIRMKQS